VKVEKLEPLVYRISYGTRSVVFELNELSKVKPSVLVADETYIGPVFDESAMRFFLIFNRKLKLFHYVLDETIPIADQLIPSGPDRILIASAKFAYYRDAGRAKILIGVFEVIRASTTTMTARSINCPTTSSRARRCARRS
jgi:hypothetical protein